MPLGSRGFGLGGVVTEGVRIAFAATHHPTLGSLGSWGLVAEAA